VRVLLTAKCACITDGESACTNSNNNDSEHASGYPAPLERRQPRPAVNAGNKKNNLENKKSQTKHATITIAMYSYVTNKMPAAWTVNATPISTPPADLCQQGVTARSSPPAALCQQGVTARSSPPAARCQQRARQLAVAPGLMA
jgi:hypothetical protein